MWTTTLHITIITTCLYLLSLHILTHTATICMTLLLSTVCFYTYNTSTAHHTSFKPADLQYISFSTAIERDLSL